MILTAKHPDIAGEKSYLAAAVAAGAIATPLKSVVGLAVNDYLVYGKAGAEKTEIVKITGITTATKTIAHAASIFAHDVNTQVQVIRYNQIKFKKKSTGDADFSVIATVDIDIDDVETRYNYTAGVPSDYFKVSYYNVALTTESQDSEPLLGSGYTRNSLYSMIEETRMYVGDKPTDNEIIMALNSAQDVVFGLKDRWNFAYKSDTQETTEDTSAYSIPTDLKILDRLDYTYNDHATTPTITTTTLPYTDFATFTATNAVDATSSDQATDWTFDEATDSIIINPSSTTGTIEAPFVPQLYTLYYWAKATPMTEYTDETLIPNPAILVFWAASKIQASKKDMDGSRLYWQEYTAHKESMTNKRIGKLKNFTVR